MNLNTISCLPIKFHDFEDNSQEGRDEASNEGCNSGPTGHDFTDNCFGEIFVVLMLYHVHEQAGICSCVAVVRDISKREGIYKLNHGRVL